MEQGTIMSPKKLKASTLIEVIIAMIIVMSVFGAAMHIFLNLESYNGNRERIRAQLLLQAALHRSLTAQDFEDNEFEIGHLQLEQIFTQQDDNGKLILVESIARNRINGRLVLKQENLVISEMYQEQQ